MTNQLQGTVINLSDILAGVIENVIPQDKAVAYEQYLEVYAQAKRTRTIQHTAFGTAQWLDKMLKEQLEQAKELPEFKAALKDAHVFGTVDALYTNLKEQICVSLLQAANIADERPDKSVPLPKFLWNEVEEIKKEANLLFKEADKILNDAGLGHIILERNEARKKKQK